MSDQQSLFPQTRVERLRELREYQRTIRHWPAWLVDEMADLWLNDGHTISDSRTCESDAPADCPAGATSGEESRWRAADPASASDTDRTPVHRSSRQTPRNVTNNGTSAEAACGYGIDAGGDVPPPSHQSTIRSRGAHGDGRDRADQTMAATTAVTNEATPAAVRTSAGA